MTEEQALHQLYIDEQFGAINKDAEEEKNKYVNCMLTWVKFWTYCLYFRWEISIYHTGDLYVIGLCDDFIGTDLFVFKGMFKENK